MEERSRARQSFGLSIHHHHQHWHSPPAVDSQELQLSVEPTLASTFPALPGFIGICLNALLTCEAQLPIFLSRGNANTHTHKNKKQKQKPDLRVRKSEEFDDCLYDLPEFWPSTVLLLALSCVNMSKDNFFKTELGALPIVGVYLPTSLGIFSLAFKKKEAPSTTSNSRSSPMNLCSKQTSSSFLPKPNKSWPSLCRCKLAYGLP